MSKIAILGAGMVGRTIAIDLAFNGHDVSSFDYNSDNLELLKEYKVKTYVYDLSLFFPVLHEFDLVISAVPGHMGYDILKKIIESKKNCVDISFFPEDPSELNELAIKNNVLAIVDCGVAPGMSNLILGRESVDNTISSFKFYVGGLPIIRNYPFEYKAPFSPIDVIEEYTRPVRMRKDSVDCVVEPLTDLERIEVNNIGTLEGFNTDGLRSLLKSFPSIPNMSEKTLRYPGYADKILLLKSMGFFKEEHIKNTAKVLMDSWKMNPDDADFTYMLVEIVSKSIDGNTRTTKYEMLDFHDGKFSSMSRTTACTCTSVVELVLKNKLDISCGVYPPEVIGKSEDNFNSILEYLSNRNIFWEKTIS